MAKHRVKIDLDESDFALLKQAASGGEDLKETVRRVLRDGVYVRTQQNEGAEILISKSGTVRRLAKAKPQNLPPSN